MWADRTTLEGDDVSFIEHDGKVVLLRGRLDGAPWSMVSVLSSSPALPANRVTLVYPWRGDIGMIEEVAVMESQPAGRGYWESFMAETDSDGKLVAPVVLDSQAWYWCTVASPSRLVLDKPYVVDARARGPYRRMTWQNLTGVGSAPFMQGILGWAFHLAAEAISEDDPADALGYRSSARRIVWWLSEYGLNPVTKGMRYGVGFSNCRGIDLSPAYGCWSSNSRNERSYNIEVFNLLGRDLQSFGTDAVPGFGEALYTATYGKHGFDSPFPGDGNFAEAVDESGFTWTMDLATKNYGQAWGVGGGNVWPAVWVSQR
jgi:hypothetical protein